MRAALLARERIKVWRLEDKQTDSGMIKKEKITVAEQRCYVINQSGRLSNQSKELFNTNQVVFRIRMNDEILPTDSLTYNGQDYKITFIKNSVYDNTREITAELINE